MATVLEVLQSAAGELGLPEPAAYTSNNLLLRLLYAVSEDLREQRAFPQQKRTHTITLEASRNKYPLPADFYSGLLGTQYNQTDSWQLIGPVSDEEWNYVLYGSGGATLEEMYRIFGPDMNQTTAGGQIQLQPTPSAADTISFDYITASLFLPPNWAVSTAYTSGQYRNVNGNIYLCDTNGTSSADVDDAPSAKTANITDNTTRWDYVDTPYETAQGGTDICLFDKRVLVNGIKSQYCLQKKEDNSQYEMAYRKGIDNARARWVGSYVTSSKGLPIRRYQIPEGSFI